MSCKCGWCKECYAQQKTLRSDEPRVRTRNQGPNHSAYPKGRKQRLDALKQAEKNFWYYFERKEDGKADIANCSWKDRGHKSRSFVCWHWDKFDDKWLVKAADKYVEAMMLCVDAGDVPPSSWYGKKS